MKIILVKSILFIFLGAFFSCESNEQDIEKANSNPSLTELKKSPDTLKIGNHTIVLSTYLWRDFMPISEENGSKLLAVNKLVEVDSLSLPNNWILKKQYVILGSDIWVNSYHETRKERDYIWYGFGKDGPKWGPDTLVDVVCEFEVSGKNYRIMARSQNINQTN
jgi:hypothetical protein